VGCTFGFETTQPVSAVLQVAPSDHGRAGSACPASSATRRGSASAAWSRLEVYLDGAWHTFDARNNRRRVGRVVVGRGRDAVDVALITSFGPVTLTEFEVRAATAGPDA
jgi:hypothetical protein